MKRIYLLVISSLCICFAYGQTDLLSTATYLFNNGEYEEAREILLKNKVEDASMLSLLGEINMRLGKYPEAEDNLKKALQFLEDNNNLKPGLYASTFNRLAILYWNRGQDSEAEKYMLRAIDIRNSHRNDDPEVLAASYNDLGLITARTNPEGALINYDKALSLYRSSFGDMNVKVAQGLINKGIIFRKMGKYNDAVNNFTEAAKIVRSLNSKGHETIAFIETNLGQTYNAMGLVPSSLKSYTSALQQYESIYGIRHPQIANLNNLIGEVKLKEGKYSEALTYFQRALITNSPDFFNISTSSYPSIDNYYHPYTLLNSLLNKSRAFQQLHFNKTLKARHLKQALVALEISDSLISKIRYSAKNEGDKLVFNEIAADVYEEAVKLSYLLAERSFSKKRYYKRAFYFNERSKAAVLQEAIRASNAKEFGNLPEEILEKENQLLTEINFITQKLRVKPNDTEEKDLRARLLIRERQHRELIEQLEKTYPSYFQLKYRQETLGVEEIQENLKQNQALLSYFTSEKNQRLYIFLITKRKFKIIEKIIDKDFTRFIAGLRNGLYFQDKSTFLLTSGYLGKLLIPSLPSKVKHLIIIPSGKLNMVPFEALFAHKAKTNSYNSLPYLINDYFISYAYSIPLFFTSQVDNNGQKKNLLMAPVDFNYPGMSLPKLPATAEECKEISKTLNELNLEVDLYLENEATEEKLVTNGQNFRIIHLATHGIINEYRPHLSRLYLNKGQGDGRLYIGELYNLKLNSDLITLSACETGLGRLSKGEGVLGFTRALIYAGAKNVVVSLWNVQDKSTAILMSSFYRETLDKNLFAGALRNAKLTMINSEKFSDPYYWAPFILVGK